MPLLLCCLQVQAQGQMGLPTGDSRLVAEAILDRLYRKHAATCFCLSACPALPCAACPALPCRAARLHAHWAVQ
jgi:hypothetical protein